jgi:imidazolonepropionase-like amidohydrolase
LRRRKPQRKLDEINMGKTIFKNATLLDGENEAAPRSAVIVGGNRIVFAGPQDDLPMVAPSDRVIDLQGRVVMPGMIQAHYHAGYHNVGSGVVMPIGMESPLGLQVLRAASNLRKTLDCGFTGAISAGSANGIDAVLFTAMAEGVIRGPRFVPGSRDVGTTGHSADLMMQKCWQSSYTGNFNRADGPIDMRRAVREEVRDGAHIVKLFVTGGHGVGTPGRMEMDADELEEAIKTAHAVGARARGHIATAEAILLAVGCGIDIVDHGDGIDEGCCEQLVRKNIPVVPSMFFLRRIVEAVGPERAAVLGGVEEEHAAAFQRANAAGVKLLVGDDYGAAILPHGDYVDELDYYVNFVGIPPLDVIRWATRNAGEFLAPGESVGVVRKGALADLLVIDGDPCQDIRILKNPANLMAIMKDGVFWKDELDQRLPCEQSDRAP